MYSWGWLIIAYLFLGGVGAGAYIVSFGIERGFFLKDSIELKKSGYYIAIPSVLIGSLLLYLDLGIAFSDPIAVFGMFLSTTSVMTWGIYILTIFIVIGSINAYLTFKNKNIPMILSYLGALFAFSTACYTGVLLMVAKGIPFWNTLLLPVLFIVSALSTGLSASSIFSSFLGKEKSDADKKEIIHVGLIFTEILLIAALIGTSIFATSSIATTNSAQMIISGDLSIVFWLFCIGLGILYPLVKFFKASDSIQKNKGHLLNNIAVLVGGFSLRTVVIFAAIPAWVV